MYILEVIMVENDNQMTMDDFDKLVAENPPGTVPPLESDSTANAETNNDNSTLNATGAETQNQLHTDQQAVNTTTQSQEGNDNQKRSANDAFAAMRVQNRKTTEALAAVLQQHGLDPNLANDPDALIAQANQARLEEEAKRQNVPTALLQRITDLEAKDREAQQKRLTDAALAGFQAVKNQFGLDNQGISAFARQLQEAGTNPFEQEMDLVHHYKLHNLDKIIAAETQKAVEEALKNQKSSTQFSTQPSKTQGKESTGTEQIDTMAKFDRFLMGLN
jgi:hypothetical protein